LYAIFGRSSREVFSLPLSFAKALVPGTCHGLGEKHMRAYLGEFCFRFSRRRFEGNCSKGR